MAADDTRPVGPVGGAVPKRAVAIPLDSLNRHLLGCYGSREFDAHEPFDTPEPWAPRCDPGWFAGTEVKKSRNEGLRCWFPAWLHFLTS